MIHFVVITGRPSAVAQLAPGLLAAVEETNVLDGTAIELLGSGQTWAAAAISAPDPTGAEHVARDDNTVVFLNGPALAVRGDQKRLAQSVLQAFREGASDGAASEVAGTYNFVGFTPGIGLRAFTDFSGMYPLYWHQGADFAVISNRSTTVEHIVGSDTWDLHALGWIVGLANLIGDCMPARGVSRLAPGEIACVDADGRMSFERSRAWVWPSPSENAGREDLTTREWDEITDALVASFGALRSFAQPLSLFLTGGKDSRLCLALIKAAGLEDIVETLTTGIANSPDVEYARTVAETAGFRHRRVGFRTRSAASSGTAGLHARAKTVPAEVIWRWLREHSFRYEAIVSPWDGVVDAGGVTLSIKGFGGELYRRSHLRWFRQHDAATASNMAKQFGRLNHDPLGILKPSEARHQERWWRQWVDSNAQMVRLDVLPEKYFVDFRLGHWNGPIEQARPADVKVNPLLLREAVAKHLELSPGARGSERFHYEVMRRAAPELVPLPFVNDAWSKQVTGVRTSEAHDAPLPKATGLPAVRARTAWQWQFLGKESKAIEQLFRDAQKTEMSEICNMRRLRTIAKNSGKIQKLIEGRALLSAVGVALALLGRSEPVRDLPHSAPEDPDHQLR